MNHNSGVVLTITIRPKGPNLRQSQAPPANDIQNLLPERWSSAGAMHGTVCFKPLGKVAYIDLYRFIDHDIVGFNTIQFKHIPTTLKWNSPTLKRTAFFWCFLTLDGYRRYKYGYGQCWFERQRNINKNTQKTTLIKFVRKKTGCLSPQNLVDLGEWYWENMDSAWFGHIP